jgi:predicted nucleotidyltransferase
MLLMSEDKILSYIIKELQDKYECHTILLYGSRARGQSSPTSDYDVIGIRKEGEIIHDARFHNGFYLDLFIYPEKDLINPTEAALPLRGGKVLLEKGTLGQEFFKKLEEIYKKGPTKLVETNVHALRLWARKSLERIKLGGIEGNFRRAEILPALLEHYFTTRGRWYEGPKTSFCILKEEQPKIYELFERAFEPNAPISTIENLIELTEKS